MFYLAVGESSKGTYVWERKGGKRFHAVMMEKNLPFLFVSLSLDYLLHTHVYYI